MKSKLIFFIILFGLIISCCLTVKESFVDHEMMNSMCNLRDKETCEDTPLCKLETSKETADRHHKKCAANGKNCSLEQQCVRKK